MSLKSALVRDYMSGKLVSFSPDTDVLDAIHDLVRNQIAGAPVVDDEGNLVGLLSELDCMKVVLTASYHDEPGGPVADLMVRDVDTVNADMSVIDLAELFLESGYRRYPVVSNNRVIGLISRRDVLRALTTISRY